MRKSGAGKKIIERYVDLGSRPKPFRSIRPN